MPPSDSGPAGSGPSDDGPSDSGPPDDGPAGAAVLAALAAGLPGYQPVSVRELAAGLDHVVHLVDDSLVIRTGRPAAGALPADQEADLLHRLGGLLSVPVPQPVFSDVGTDSLGYRMLPGEPLLTMPADARSAVAADVGRLLGGSLADLHLLTEQDLGDCQVDAALPDETLADAVRSFTAISAAVPGDLHPQVETFLGTAPPALQHRHLFSHNDLGIEHVLVGPSGAVTGIIDWSDAAFCDPARDFDLLLRDLGTVGLDSALAGYRRAGGPATVDARFRQRCLFHARCGLLEDWAYGLATGRRPYSDKSLHAAAELFAG